MSPHGILRERTLFLVALERPSERERAEFLPERRLEPRSKIRTQEEQIPTRLRELLCGRRFAEAMGE